MAFFSSKKVDGFSTCFRQWRAEGTHCKFLHGYALEFVVDFEGGLDERNWVWDFGGFKRSDSTLEFQDFKGENLKLSPSDYFKWLLDHTTLIAETDPEIDRFIELHKAGVIQLRVLPEVGIEILAQHLFEVIDKIVREETRGRVRATRVAVSEHSKNTAGYYQKV